MDFLSEEDYIISTTARLTIFPWSRSWYALPTSSNSHFLETAALRLKIPVSASLTNLGRSCLARAPYEPMTFICYIRLLYEKNEVAKWKPVQEDGNCYGCKLSSILKLAVQIKLWSCFSPYYWSIYGFLRRVKLPG